ncbi:hypothetical protein DBY68_001290 [Pseudocitrobacter sp. RIT415]|nr:hypothetical protein DBY68_001290 [Pseudocitrobacter sp. RIT 415]
MLHVVTEARSVGAGLRQRNQTSDESIGLTRYDVAILFLRFYVDDHRNGIWLANLARLSFICLGDFCFRSFLSVISVTYLNWHNEQLEGAFRGA